LEDRNAKLHARVPVLESAVDKPAAPGTEKPSESISAAALVQKYWDGMSKKKRFAMSVGLIATGVGITALTGGVGAVALSALGIGGNTLAGWFIGGAVGGVFSNSMRSSWNLLRARRKFRDEYQHIERKAAYFAQHMAKGGVFGALVGGVVGSTDLGELIKDGVGHFTGWLSSYMPEVPPSSELPPPPASGGEQGIASSQLHEKVHKGFGDLLAPEPTAPTPPPVEPPVRVEPPAPLEAPAPAAEAGPLTFTLGEDARSVWEGLAQEFREVPGFERLGDQGALATLHAFTNTLTELDVGEQMEYLRRVFPDAPSRFLDYVIDHPIRFDHIGNVIDNGWAARVPSGVEFNITALASDPEFREQWQELVKGSARSLAGVWEKL
jgi:hypothetical protein